MKRALLWLGPLACLALACLYAYAWFNRDPLAVAFERVAVGMTMEQVETIMGKRFDRSIPSNSPSIFINVHDDDGSEKTVEAKVEIWRNDNFLCRATFHDERVAIKSVVSARESAIDKISRCLRHPASLWSNEAAPAPYLYMPDSPVAEDHP